jgi:hypothetical protein
VKAADAPIPIRISPQNIVTTVKTVGVEGPLRKNFVHAGVKIQGTEWSTKGKRYNGPTVVTVDCRFF